MECADCRERPAAVFIRRASGDLALCEACARSRGIMAGSGGLDIRLEGLFDAVSSAPPKALSCAGCGSELSLVAREGRLGCASCVSSFRPELLRRLASRDAARRRIPRPQPPEPSLQRPAEGQARRSSWPSSFPFDFPAFSAFGDLGPEDDVVLLSSARVSRCLEGLPFPGSPAAGPAPSRGRILKALSSMPGWKVLPLASTSVAQRLALKELAFLPSAFVSDPAAAIAASGDSPLYALEDEGDHLKACARLPGLACRAAAGLALDLAAKAGQAVEASGGPRFARDPEIGWICSTIEELGEGLLVAALVHLPALAMAGLQDRLFRALMAEGIQVRGAYAEEGSSVGALYGLAATGPAGGSAAEIVSALESAARSAAAAERRAREEIARREREALLDAAGRALGILSNARRVGWEEAASLLSSLRLAALSGLLSSEGEAPGEPARRLGVLLGLAGPGCAAAFGGGLEPVTESGRACFLRREVERLALSEEDRCSRD